MKTTLILSLLLFKVSLLFAQGVNNLWLSGYNSGGGSGFGGTNIDFNSGAPIIYQQNRPMNITESFSSICDKNGNLLFYSNGYYIANRNDDTLLNGTDFNSGSITSAFAVNGLPITQGVLIIPSPGDTNQYYLFSLSAEVVDSSVQPIRLTCSLIDMSMDNSLGGIVWKDSTIINDTLTMGMLTASKHANGRDWWIIIPEYHSNCYYKLLLTPFGINSNGKQCLGQTTGYFDWSGQASFSPDGEKYARYDKDNGLFILNFDRCSGSFSNLNYLFINDSAQCGGVAFSPNSQFLYISSFNYIYQFDMLSANILLSKTTIGIYDGFLSPFSTTFYLEQLAPDGKIYIVANNGVNVMHCINQPDNVGANCDLQQHSINLPTYNAYTSPNHPNYFLGALNGSICDSLYVNILDTDKSVSRIELSPNPTTGILNIYSEVKIFKVTLSNFLGEAVYSNDLNCKSAHIDFSNFPRGIYFLNLSNTYGISTRKIILE
jgi:hypothetical protein